MFDQESFDKFGFTIHIRNACKRLLMEGYPVLFCFNLSTVTVY